MQTRLKERKKINTKNKPLNWQNFRDFGLTNQATMQCEKMNITMRPKTRGERT